MGGVRKAGGILAVLAVVVLILVALTSTPTGRAIGGGIWMAVSAIFGWLIGAGGQLGITTNAEGNPSKALTIAAIATLLLVLLVPFFRSKPAVAAFAGLLIFGFLYVPGAARQLQEQFPTGGTVTADLVGGTTTDCRALRRNESRLLRQYQRDRTDARHQVYMNARNKRIGAGC